VLLHHREDTDDDLGARANEHLALATLLSVDNVVEAVGLRGGRDVSSATVQRAVGREARTRTETRMAERGERVRANRGKGSERWPRRVCVRGARSPALQQESAGRSRTRARERSRSWCADDSTAVQTVFRPASWRTRSGRAWRAWLVEGGGCDGVCAEAQSVPNERCAESGSRRDGRSEDEEELPVEGEDEGQLLEAARGRVRGGGRA